MAACPKGHESETTDYCDVCGAAMASSGQQPAPSSDPRPAPATRPAVCPECQTPMTGRGSVAVPDPVAGDVVGDGRGPSGAGPEGGGVMAAPQTSQ